MTVTKAQKKRDLGQDISEYWHAYGQHLDLAEGMARSWSELPAEVQKTLQSKSYAVIRSSADLDGSLLQDTPLPSEITPFCPQPSILVKWGGRSVVILPWLELKDITEEGFSSICSGLSASTLTIGITPQFHSRQVGEMVQHARSLGYALILAAPDDADALARLAWSLSELINYKVMKIYLEAAVDADATYSDWQMERFRRDLERPKAKELVLLKSTVASKRGNQTIWLRHPSSDDLADTLRTHNFALLVGKSASGKTILALSVGERLLSGGSTVWYVDIAQLTSKSVVTVGMSVFREALRSSKRIVLILDDLHTQGNLGKSLLTFLRLLQRSLLGDQLYIVGVCWPEYRSEIANLIGDGRVLLVRAATMQEALIRQFGQNLAKDETSRIRELAGEDLFLLHLWLENSNQGHLADEMELARRVWLSRSKSLRGQQNAHRRALFIAYLIGQFECDVPILFLETLSGVNRSQIDELIRAKLLNNRVGSLSPPHRSFAKLMAKYLSRERAIWLWLSSHGLARTTGEIFVRYLEALDSSQVWSALKLIERGGVFEESRSSHDHLRMIMSIWRSLDALLRKMEDQQAEDPSWRHAISSAYFACQALCTVGKYKEAQGSIEFIRDCYSISGGRMEIELGKLSTVEDFKLIHKCLEIEEQEDTFPIQYGLETSRDIDIDLFHANWAAGLALGAEAYMGTLSNEELKERAIAVERRIEEGGYFYPARVPWLSARMLMGLSLCGRNIENSQVVRTVAEWLLRDRRDGGAREGRYWLPGTDGWNTILETTAMVIIALRLVGVSADNEVLLRANGYILEEKPKWTRVGSELDGAFALEAYLSMTGSWEEIRTEALYLADWADTIALWRNATESAKHTHEQSCRAAATAAVLIKAMWTTLRNDVPKLLVAFGVAEDNPKNGGITMLKGGVPAGGGQGQYEWDIVISYASEDGAYVDQVARCLEASGVRVFYDKFEQADMWGKDLYTHLDDVYRKKGRYCVMFLSSDYERKAWTNHERRIAQARAFQENNEYILPVRFDNTEIPGVLPTIGYINADKVDARELCRLIQTKLTR